MGIVVRWGLGLPVLLIAVTLLPILGYHITQARRLFLAGYSLGGADGTNSSHSHDSSHAFD